MSMKYGCLDSICNNNTNNNKYNNKYITIKFLLGKSMSMNWQQQLHYNNYYYNCNNNNKYSNKYNTIKFLLGKSMSMNWQYAAPEHISSIFV